MRYSDGATLPGRGGRSARDEGGRGVGRSAEVIESYLAVPTRQK